MARYRTFRPEYFTDAKVGRLSIPARLLFLSILPHADDRSGVFDARPTVIRAASFPGDRISDARILKMLAEIEATGMIRTFESEGLPYGWVVNFTKYQKVDKPGPQRFPNHPFGESSANDSSNDSGTPRDLARARVGKECSVEERREVIGAGAPGKGKLFGDEAAKKKPAPEDPNAWRSRTAPKVLELIDVLRREVSKHNPTPNWEKPKPNEAIDGQWLVTQYEAGKIGDDPARSKDRLLYILHACPAKELWRGKLWTLSTVRKNLNLMCAETKTDWDTFKNDADPFEVFRNE